MLTWPNVGLKCSNEDPNKIEENSRPISDCENRAEVELIQIKRHAGSWLSWLPLSKKRHRNTDAGTSRWSAWISQGHLRELCWAQLYGPSVTQFRSLSSLQTFHTHTPSFTHNFHTHTHAPSFTHNFVTYHLEHTTSSTHIFVTLSFTHHLRHTPSHTHTRTHTHNFVTRNIVTHHLSHNFLSHSIFHTQLVTHTHTSLHIQPFNSSILHHLLCRSFLPLPAGFVVSASWKKLTCGVFRSLIFSAQKKHIKILLFAT